MNRKKRVAIPENALELARLVAEAHQDDDPVRRKVQRSCDRYRLKLTQGLTSRRCARPPDPGPVCAGHLVKMGLKGV